MARNNDYAIGLPDDVFRRLLQGIHDHQEGLALRRIREYLQISLEEAANHAAISASDLSRIERSHRNARQWTLMKLCMLSLSLSAEQTITILRIAGRSPA